MICYVFENWFEIRYIGVLLIKLYIFSMVKIYMLIKLKYFIIYKYLKVVYFLGYIFIILCFKLKVIL